VGQGSTRFLYKMIFIATFGRSVFGENYLLRMMIDGFQSEKRAAFTKTSGRLA
jgi:hypothetical protein